MANLVGRIGWTIVETLTGASESGVTPIRLEEVSVVVHEITYREQLRLDRTTAYLTSKAGGPPRALDAEDKQTIQQIHEEVEASKDPELDRVLRVWYSKEIVVGDNVKVIYSEHPHTNGAGFGLSAKRAGKKDFGWDWFNVTGPNTAAKLQESGVISFKTDETALEREVVYMRFESDVSLRISELGTAYLMKPLVRVNIASGSEIYWPSLVDGKVVSNGFIEDY